MHGTKDPDYPDPDSEARLAQSLLTRAKVAMVQGAGHYPQIEQPQLVANLITEFLRG